MTKPRRIFLRFTSWNTRGIRNTKQVCNKNQTIFKLLKQLKTQVAFLQETHVGLKSISVLKRVNGWTSYFTVHSPRSKGVAILVKKSVPFEYICHDEDYGGSYTVLFCRLYGELFTLVNVYNHKADREVLHRLAEYLKETKAGMLVVGGDFNTVLNPDLDRITAAGHIEHTPLRRYLENFTATLKLRDIWGHLHPTENAFTRSQNQSFSRLDMFFMPEDRLQRVHKCKVNKLAKGNISDHKPITLKISVQRQTKNHTPDVASMLGEFGYHGKPVWRAEKISGAEILSAIKSLSDSEQPTPDGLEVQHYRKFCLPMTEILKINYNLMLKNDFIPTCFSEYSAMGQGKIRSFNVDYLIFATVIAKRLSVYLRPSFQRRKRNRCDFCIMITFRKPPKKIRWSFLNTALKHIHPVPPRDFSTLENLLAANDPLGDSKKLRKGCPLTQPILTLALKHLAQNILTTDHTASICHHRQCLLISLKEERLPIVEKLVRWFERCSGLRVRMKKKRKAISNLASEL